MYEIISAIVYKTKQDINKYLYKNNNPIYLQ